MNHTTFDVGLYWYTDREGTVYIFSLWARGRPRGQVPDASLTLQVPGSLQVHLARPGLLFRPLQNQHRFEIAIPTPFWVAMDHQSRRSAYKCWFADRHWFRVRVPFVTFTCHRDLVKRYDMSHADSIMVQLWCLADDLLARAQVMAFDALGEQRPRSIQVAQALGLVPPDPGPKDVVFHQVAEVEEVLRLRGLWALAGEQTWLEGEA